MPTLLWTDILFYLLLLGILCFTIYVQKSPLLRQSWGQVFTRPLPTFSCMILLAYTLIALLDSMHFHPALPTLNAHVFYSSEVKSLLDVLLAPLGKREEGTYSAPFAIDFSSDATQHLIIFAIIKALTIWLIITGILIGLCAYQEKRSIISQLIHTLQGKTPTAWRAIFLALGLIILVAAITLNLSKSYHILGTSLIGQDIFYQTLKSIRTGLIIGTLTTLFMLPFAAVCGTVAGYFSGWIDDIIQYIYTTLSSIPGVLLITAAILSLQLFMQNHAHLFPDLASRADARLLILCAILGVTGWTDLCRLLRGETLKLREIDFVQAAVVMGVPSYKIITQHILPNVMHIILITVVLDFSALVLAEAVLSYVGVGVDPSTISWGNMINSARMELAREPVVWWPLFAAFIFMFTLVLSANVFADAVRDAFDPRRVT
jgi:peptide/nickel transport system permease protein